MKLRHENLGSIPGYLRSDTAHLTIDEDFDVVPDLDISSARFFATLRRVACRLDTTDCGMALTVIARSPATWQSQRSRLVFIHVINVDLASESASNM